VTDYANIRAIAVEDDEGSALLIQAILRRIGMDVNTYPTGEHFLEFLHSLPTPPNLILLDINLPRKNGIDIIKELRSDPQFRDILVIAISAVDPIKYVPIIKEAGFNSFLRKPVSREHLPKQIQRVLAGEAIWEMY
jgi:CheY-like chemotaxis protein